MSEEPRAVVEEIEQEEVGRARLFHLVTVTGASMATVALVLFVVIGLLVPQFPSHYLVPVAGVFLSVSLLSIWLNRRGRLSWAIAVYTVTLTVSLFVAIYVLNGVTGPLAVALIAIPVLAGLLGGRRAACWTVVTVALLYLAMAILGELDIVQPWEISGLTLRVITYGMFLATLVTVAFIAATFVDLAQRALSSAQQRGQELAEVSLRAEHVAQAEREAREREERAAHRLRQTVQEYSAFLKRVAAGDYSARLALDEGGQVGGEGGELLALGHRLNATVETLVAALRDLEAIQRRYVRRAWEGFARAGLAHRGFRYQGGEVEPADEAWLSPMAGAVQRKSPTADERDLALPVTLRGQVIGAMGVRREQMTGWSDDDLALAQAIADQLAQTIESLRLLDETERRATREQLVGEVTARMRETLELETVLKTAASEMRRALGLEEFVVRLGTEEADGQSA